jgi:hypothetical protein
VAGHAENRVRVNWYKNSFLWRVKLEGVGPGDIESKQGQYAQPPSPGSVIVTDETEEWTPVQPSIQAEDVKDDGKALRLMIAAGAGIPLHYLAEGESATRATAREMVGPTVKHYEHRQMFFCDMLLGSLLRMQGGRGVVTLTPALSPQGRGGRGGAGGGGGVVG